MLILPLPLTQVTRHSVDMCGSYSSCEECAFAPDPVCGWCALRGQCTRESLCTPLSDNNNVLRTVWLNNGSCPLVTNAAPSVIYHEDLSVSNRECRNY